ncbi:MAG: hypothetical protein AAFW69_03395 [Pseudomonadota bacterium]
MLKTTLKALAIGALVTAGAGAATTAEAQTLRGPGVILNNITTDAYQDVHRTHLGDQRRFRGESDTPTRRTNFGQTDDAVQEANFGGNYVWSHQHGRFIFVPHSNFRGNHFGNQRFRGRGFRGGFNRGFRGRGFRGRGFRGRGFRRH